MTISPSSSFVFELRGCAVYILCGDDHVRYLHARCTQDVKGLSVGSSSRALVLTPQGKIQAQMDLYRRDADIVIVSDTGGPEFSTALLQFRVADRVELTECDLRVISVQGEGAAGIVKQRFSIDPVVGTFTIHGGRIVAWRDRGVSPGIDLLVPAGDVAGEIAELWKLGATSGDDETFDRLRIEAGRPMFGRDLSEKVSAGEIDLSELVSFQKGCYAGQEVVEMTSARGKPNRQLRCFVASGKVSPNDPITSGDKQVGFITSVAPAGEGVMALGFVKSDFLSTSDLRSGGVPLSLR